MPPRASGGGAGGGRAPVPSARSERTADARSARAQPRQEQRQGRAGAAGAYRLGYERGHGGAPDDRDRWADHPHAGPYGQGYAAGTADRPAAAAPPASSTSTAPEPRAARPPSSLTSWVPKEAGGFVLGLFLYAIVINWARGGPGQARAWLAAKFLNKVAGTDTGTVGAPAPPAPPNVASGQGTGAVAPQPYPGGPQVAIPGLGNGNVRVE